MENDQTQKRQVAFKCSINQINNSNFIKNEGLVPNYLQIGDKKASRLNIIAAIVEKDETSQSLRFTIDDGTARINLISYENIPNINKVNLGDVVIVIGKPRVMGEDKYIMPEIIRPIDKEWLKIRKSNLPDVKPSKKEETIVEQVLDTNLAPFELVIETIRIMDKGDGVSYEEINAKLKINDFENLITGLLERGEIFEIRPGKFKVLE
jgi:hypothetical protein